MLNMNLLLCINTLYEEYTFGQYVRMSINVPNKRTMVSQVYSHHHWIYAIVQSHHNYKSNQSLWHLLVYYDLTHVVNSECHLTIQMSLTTQMPDDSFLKAPIVLACDPTCKFTI